MDTERSATVVGAKYHFKFAGNLLLIAGKVLLFAIVTGGRAFSFEIVISEGL